MTSSVAIAAVFSLLRRLWTLYFFLVFVSFNCVLKREGQGRCENNFASFSNIFTVHAEHETFSLVCRRRRCLSVLVRKIRYLCVFLRFSFLHNNENHQQQQQHIKTLWGKGENFVIDDGVLNEWVEQGNFFRGKTFLLLLCVRHESSTKNSSLCAHRKKNCRVKRMFVVGRVS